MQTQTTQQTPARSPWRKALTDQHRERVTILLRRRDRALLERLADGEPVGSYVRRALRRHMQTQLSAQG